jgi:hypothetical protein
MADEVLDAEAIEEPEGSRDGSEAEVRPLPEPRGGGALEPFSGEVRSVAIAAAGGLAAGAATFAAVSAVRGGGLGKASRRAIRRARKRDNVVASRSFLVDVHVLGR